MHVLKYGNEGYLHKQRPLLSFSISLLPSTAITPPVTTSPYCHHHYVNPYHSSPLPSLRQSPPLFTTTVTPSVTITPHCHHHSSGHRHSILTPPLLTVSLYHNLHSVSHYNQSPILSYPII